MKGASVEDELTGAILFHNEPVSHPSLSDPNGVVLELIYDDIEFNEINYKAEKGKVC